MTLDGSREGYTGRQKRKARHIEEGYEKGVPAENGEERTWVKLGKSIGTGKKRTGLPGGPIMNHGVPRPGAKRAGPTLARKRAPAGVA